MNLYESLSISNKSLRSLRCISVSYKFNKVYKLNELNESPSVSTESLPSLYRVSIYLYLSLVVATL